MCPSTTFEKLVNGPVLLLPGIWGRGFVGGGGVGVAVEGEKNRRGGYNVSLILSKLPLF